MKIKDHILKSAQSRVEAIIIDECCKILKCNRREFKRKYKGRSIDLTKLKSDELKHVLFMPEFQLRMEIFSAISATVFVDKMNREESMSGDNKETDLKN